MPRSFPCLWTYPRSAVKLTDTNRNQVTAKAENDVERTEHLAERAEPRTVKITTENELLALQIQAFLHASQDVDIDEETIEDILDVLTTEDESRAEGHPSDSHFGLMDEDGIQDEAHDVDAEDILALKGPKTPHSMPLLEG